MHDGLSFVAVTRDRMEECVKLFVNYSARYELFLRDATRRCDPRALVSARRALSLDSDRAPRSIMLILLLTYTQRTFALSDLMSLRTLIQLNIAINKRASR